MREGNLNNDLIQKNRGKLESMAFSKGHEDPRTFAVNVESKVPDGNKSDHRIKLIFKKQIILG